MHLLCITEPCMKRSWLASWSIRSTTVTRFHHKDPTQFRHRDFIWQMSFDRTGTCKRHLVQYMAGPLSFAPENKAYRPGRQKPEEVMNTKEICAGCWIMISMLFGMYCSITREYQGRRGHRQPYTCSTTAILISHFNCQYLNHPSSRHLSPLQSS